MEVVARKEDLAGREVAGRTAVVIDVLRATSTCATALAAGARAILPCASPEEARAQATTLRASERLLAGEHGAMKIPGFDLGNSPREYLSERVAGHEVVLVTTNGTRALRLLADRDTPPREILMGSLLNATAVARYAAASGRTVLLVCSGTQGHFSLDDFLGAGRLAHLLEEQGYELDDLALAARDTYRHNAQRLPEALASCRHAGILYNVGLGEDVAFCARTDVFSQVAALRGDRVVALPAEVSGV